MVGILAVAILAAGCPKRVSIAEIQADPGRFTDRDVAIAGVVRDSWGLNIPGILKGGAYKVDDGTGTIWVITDNAVPNRGAEVGVKGRVGSGVSIGGRNFGLGLMEKDRKFRRR